MRELTIAGHVINDASDAWVCAELGCNHQGSVATCKDLMRAARESGADAVKLQRRDLATWEALDPEAWHAPYNSENAFGATYGEHRAALEFDFEQYRELQSYAESLSLVFFATAFDVPSLRFLQELEVPAIKLASASIVDEPLLRACAELEIPIIASTGGATIEEIDAAADILWESAPARWTQFAWLQCTAIYPCEPADMNLTVIPMLRDRYPQTVVGLSDHQSGIAMAPVAYALGARIFEKHFTLSRSWKGSDQAFSLEPVGLKKLVRDLHRTRLALGSGVKRRLAAEVPALVKMGRGALKQEVPSAFVTA